MFNWVCPHCGKDVPPSKTECPYCHGAPEPVAAVPPPGYYPNPGHPAPAWQPPAQPVPAGPVSGQPLAQPQAWQPPVSAPPQGWQTAPPPPPPPAAPPAQAHAFAPPQQNWPPPPPYGQPQPHPAQSHPAQSHPAQTHPAQSHPSWSAPPHKAPIPTWLLGLGFTAAFLLVGAGLYFGIQRYGHTNAQEKAGLENPANPSQQKVSNPLQKYVEVVGIRMVTQDKKPAARFVVVNHSTAEIANLAANVTLWASTSRSEEDSVGSFSFNLGSLGPNAGKELTEPLKTRLKAYELPDWQNVTAEIQITSPAQ